MQILPTREELRLAIPGLLLVVVPIAALSEALYWVESDYVESVFRLPAPVIAIMIAAVITIILTNAVRLPSRCSEGLRFTTKWLLKIGIVLYGFNFSYALWLKPGAEWILLIGVTAVIVPLTTAYFLGRLIRLGNQSSLLVGVGTGICGISAILATQQATKSDEESAGMALATILVFGTIVLFVYPALAKLLLLSSSVYGIWTGATTLDLPQLVAAALQGGGGVALLSGLWVKSIRIGLLVPVILILLARPGMLGRTATENGARRWRTAMSFFPFFILAFFLVILYNSVLPIPAWLAAPLATGKGEFLSLNFANIFLMTAIIGICVRVKRDVIGNAGWKILLIGGASWLLQSLLVFYLSNALPMPQM